MGIYQPLDEVTQQVIEAVMKRSLNDSEFRQLCLTNGTAAIEKITGNKLPEGVKIKFVEGEGTTQVFSLPEFIGEGAELTDELLEQVAGGCMCDDLCNPICNPVCNPVI